MNDQVKVVAETECGAIYHDETTDEWLVDVGTKGLTLYFDREEFTDFLELIRHALDYQWEIRDQRRSA